MSGSVQFSQEGCTEYEVKSDLPSGEPPPDAHCSQISYGLGMHYLSENYEEYSINEKTAEVSTTGQDVPSPGKKLKISARTCSPKKAPISKKGPRRKKPAPLANTTKHQKEEPSPAMFMECEITESDTLLDFSSMEVQSNLGSESESDDENGETILPTVPRSFRDAMAQPDEVWDYAIPHTDPRHTPEVHSQYNASNFQWKELPKPPVPFDSRRQDFTEKHGPTTLYNEPYAAFIAIWDKEFLEHIAVETNRYAQQLALHMMANDTLQPRSRICDWTDTTSDELYVYFAVVLAMGVVIKASMEEYWATSKDIFQTPGFHIVMSVKRFQLLSRCLHFNNNQEMRELNSVDAKLFKIKPVIEHLNHKFQSLYRLGRNLSLDEWLDINHFIPNKAAKVEIKTYELCESQSGYLWRFEVHSHKSPDRNRDPMETSTWALVLRLLQGLENKGHTVWMDNHFNSPALARKLKSLGFDCVGTLRTNRHVPIELAALTRDMLPGQITGLTSGDVDIVIWRDKNKVATISTYHGGAVTKDGEIQKPTVVVDYNTMMGGVDKKEMLAAYPIERMKTKIWYKKMFRRLLNVSVLNAFILCKKQASHRGFRMALIKSIIEKHGVVFKSSDERGVPTRRATSAVIAKHHLAEYPKLPSQQGRLRRVCCVCKKRVSTYCVGCEKTACMTPCFVALHCT